MNDIKRILVTGSSGTIGTRLCQLLLGEGYEVTGVDRKPNKWSGQVNNLTIIGDLTDRKVLDNLPGNLDLVIHLAANARVYELVKNPNLARDNFETLFNVMEFARRNKIKRVFFSSSREVYGNSDKIIHNEDESYVRNCESPYTATKIGGEALVHAYQMCYGIDFVILRFSNVYGMYDESDRVVPLFIRLTKENKDLVVYGKDKLLDFTYIDDAVGGIIRAIKIFEKTKNDTYNLSSGEGTTLIEIAQMIRLMMGGKNQIKDSKSRTGEIIRFVADLTKAKILLGYEPKIKVQEGIKRSTEWYTKTIWK
ncbi:NAD-dependent epimerase/dehydratase family protein [Chloroflexota bacterium]